jgi:hypothetical protein
VVECRRLRGGRGRYRAISSNRLLIRWSCTLFCDERTRNDTRKVLRVAAIAGNTTHGIDEHLCGVYNAPFILAALPQSREPGRVERRIPHSILNLIVAQVVLDETQIAPLVRQVVAAGVA